MQATESVIMYKREKLHLKMPKDLTRKAHETHVKWGKMDPTDPPEFNHVASSAVVSR